MYGFSWKIRRSGNTEPIFPYANISGTWWALQASDKECVSSPLFPTWSPSRPLRASEFLIHDSQRRRKHIPLTSDFQGRVSVMTSTPSGRHRKSYIGPLSPPCLPVFPPPSRAREVIWLMRFLSICPPGGGTQLASRVRKRAPPTLSFSGPHRAVR